MGILFTLGNQARQDRGEGGTMETIKKAFRIVEGSVVRARGATWQEAADALARECNCGGVVIFSCPNYAVVQTSPTTEVTIWAK